MMNSSLYAVGGIALGLLTLLVILFLYLVLLKVAVNRRESRMDLLLSRYSDSDSALSRYLAEGIESRSALPRTPLAYEVMERFLMRRLKVSRDSAEKERIYRLASGKLAGRCRDRLRHRRRSERMNAMFTAESFRLTELGAPILSIAAGHPRRRGLEVHMACRVLASFQHQAALDILADRERQLPVYLIRQMLQLLEMEGLEVLMDRYDTLPPATQANLVDVLRVRNVRTERVLELLESLLGHPDAELRIRALKAISNFGYMNEEAVELLLARLSEDASLPWQERMMALRLMGSLREDRFLPYLEARMGDSSYLVRLEAGRSIALFPGGLNRLRRIAESHPDRYARESAAERLVTEG